MLKKLQNTNTGWAEFFIKFPIAFFLIMPGCMVGCFLIGLKLDSLLNIHILKIIGPVIGSVIGLFFTGLLILAGHARESATGVIKDLKAQSSGEPVKKQMVSSP